MAEDLLRALALMAIFEGLMPFVAPGRMRQAWARLAMLDERTLRVVGLAAMIAGLVSLQLMRWQR